MKHPQRHRMRALVIVPLLLPLMALAQYKCTAADGSISFQQTACAGVQKQQVLVIKPAMGSDPPAAANSTADQRMVRAMEQERRVRGVEQTIINTEHGIDNRNALMSAEVAALSNRKSAARNNLAGATYEQSLSTEMQAVSSKYKVLNDVDIERLKQLRIDLANLR